MNILGIDPGQTTGWTLYEAEARIVLKTGKLTEAFIDGVIPIRTADSPEHLAPYADVVVIERPVAHGPTRPQVVDCAWVAGQLYSYARELSPKTYTLTRHEIRKTLTEATHGCVRVVNDATCWAALVLLHGEDSDRKPRTKKGVVIDEGGPLGGVTSHSRAALAAAVAWSLREGVTSDA